MRPRKAATRHLPPRMYQWSRPRKSGKTWIAYYYLDSTGKAIPLGKDLDQARLKWAELEAKEIPLDLRTMKGIFDRYIRDIVPKKAPRTQRDNLSEIKQLRPLFDNAPIDSITPATIAGYRDARTAKIRANREIATLYFDQVQKLYIAYFGRPADPTGLNYWAANIDALGGNFDAAIKGFAASTESQTLYAAGTTAQLVSSIYVALFNRPPETAGLAYWASLIDAGTITGARAAYEILNSAGPGDVVAIANKVTAANAFTTNVDITAEINGYSGPNSATVARAFLAKVDATSYSISNLTADTTKAVIDATGVSPAGPVVVPITLTDIAANLHGKVFAASSGPGDVLNVTDAPTVPTNLAGLSGFETVNLSGSTALITVANGAGITINNTGSVGVVVKLGSGGQTFNGGSGTYTVNDGSGNDTLNFGAGNYTTLAGGGVDTFNVGAGAVANLGGVGPSDTVVVSAGGTATMSPSNYIANGITLTNNGIANFINISSIDLSLATGSNGFNLTGSVTANTIMGSSKADTLTGGAGADVFKFDAASRSTLANMDTINDYRAATGANAGALDTINLTDIVTVASNINTVQDYSAQASLAAALNVLANAATTNNGLGVFIWGGDTYAYVETTGATTTYVAGDTVIKLSGTPFTAGTSIVGLGIDGV